MRAGVRRVLETREDEPLALETYDIVVTQLRASVRPSFDCSN